MHVDIFIYLYIYLYMCVYTLTITNHHVFPDIYHPYHPCHGKVLIENVGATPGISSELRCVVDDIWPGGRRVKLPDITIDMIFAVDICT